jgi:hypothetical protein
MTRFLLDTGMAADYRPDCRELVSAVRPPPCRFAVGEKHGAVIGTRGRRCCRGEAKNALSEKAPSRKRLQERFYPLGPRPRCA